MGFFALSVVASVVLNKMLMQWPENTRGLAKKLLKGYPKIFLWLGITGLVVEFFRYENVPYLSMRAITYLLTMLIIGFVGKMVYVRFSVYPKEYKMMLNDVEKKKYLPKKKI